MVVGDGDDVGDGDGERDGDGTGVERIVGDCVGAGVRSRVGEGRTVVAPDGPLSSDMHPAPKIRRPMRMNVHARFPSTFQSHLGMGSFSNVLLPR